MSDTLQAERRAFWDAAFQEACKVRMVNLRVAAESADKALEERDMRFGGAMRAPTHEAPASKWQVIFKGDHEQCAEFTPTDWTPIKGDTFDSFELAMDRMRERSNCKSTLIYAVREILA